MSVDITPAQMLLNPEMLFGENQNTDGNIIIESRAVRADVYRHLTKIIELIWPDLIAKVNLDDGKLYYSNVKFDRNSNSKLLDFNFENHIVGDELLKQLVLKDPFRNIWAIRDAYCQKISSVLIEMHSKIVNQHDYISAADLMSELDHYSHLQPEIRPITIIRGGFHTACYFIFDIIRVVPILYFQKYGKPVDQESVSRIVVNSTKLIMMAASMHREVLSSLRTYFQTEANLHENLPPERSPFDYEFPIHFFDFDDVNQQIIFKFEVLSAWRINSEQNNSLPKSQRLGCPARHATSGSPHQAGENVIQSLIESQLNFTLRYLEPVLDVYGKNKI